MNILSFNIHGLGGGLKRVTFKRLLDSVHPGVVCLQETMSSSFDAYHFFLSLRPSWFVSAVDSDGHSRGCPVAWKPCLANFSAYVTCAGLLLKGKFINLDVPIHILNIYASYS